LLQPQCVTSILLALKARQDERQACADRRVVGLARQASDAEERLGRLYAAIEAGTVDGTDPSLKERVAALKSARDRAVEGAEYARKSSARPVQIDPIAIDRFTRLMREQLVSGDVAARKAYLASIVDAVIVSEDKIRIIGSNDNIRSTVGPKGQPTPVVRKSVHNGAQGRDRTTDTAIFSHAYPQVLRLWFLAIFAASALKR
jgi:site-specific DNA recombinase